MIQTKTIFITAFLLLVGIGFFVATTVRVINTLEFISRAKTADGIVIVTKHAKSHPRIEYTNAAGEKRWFLANEWIPVFRIVSYKTGQHVRVLYDPADPVAFSVDDFESLYTVPIYGGMLGIVFVVLSLGALLGKFSTKTTDVLGAVVFFLIGIGCIAGNFAWTKNAREFISKAKIIDGVVIDTSDGGSHPDIGYTTPSGEKDWVPGKGHISGYKVGEHVRVLYDPAEPAHPKIDDFGFLYASLYFGSIFGFITIVMGILTLCGLTKSSFDQ
jgi:amino acid transporter